MPTLLRRVRRGVEPRRRERGLAQPDITLLAAARLEAAVERLARALAARPAPEGVPREKVAALAARLDETLAKLRAALDDGGG
jgi:hypothetical protein